MPTIHSVRRAFNQPWRNNLRRQLNDARLANEVLRNTLNLERDHAKKLQSELGFYKHLVLTQAQQRFGEASHLDGR